MKKIVTIVAMAVAAISTQASANSFTPKFSDYAFPGTQFTVDAAANAYYSANYGITIQNAYLYKDSRDTFDGIGVSTGTTAEFGTTQTARISFLDTTDFVTIDWWTISPTTVYSAYTASNSLIDTFTKSGSQTGTYSFNGNGSLISYITWTSQTGYGQISGLTYNYDGITDGRNTDIGNPSAVPLPAALPLMLSGLGVLGFASRRRKESV